MNLTKSEKHFRGLEIHFFKLNFKRVTDQTQHTQKATEPTKAIASPFSQIPTELFQYLQRIENRHNGKQTDLNRVNGKFSIELKKMNLETLGSLTDSHFKTRFSAEFRRICGELARQRLNGEASQSFASAVSEVRKRHKIYLKIL